MHSSSGKAAPGTPLRADDRMGDAKSAIYKAKWNEFIRSAVYSCLSPLMNTQTHESRAHSAYGRALNLSTSDNWGRVILRSRGLTWALEDVQQHPQSVPKRC